MYRGHAGEVIMIVCVCSLSGFFLFLLILTLYFVFVQAFPQEADGRRAVKLTEWLQQGGGPSIIARERQ